MQTAAVGFGGAPGQQADTEEYDGTSWSNGHDFNTGRSTATGCGLQAAAIVAGGAVAGDAGITTVEADDGSNWTAVTSMKSAN